MQFGFLIDNRKCIGCHACTVACKAEHDTPVGVNRTWVKYIEKGQFPNTARHFSVMRCNHCADAPCVEICPVTALYRREDGIVDFDSRRCIGCKACMQACPYDALYIDPRTHTAAKCNYCAHRVDLGLEPACVNVCPEHAIVSGDLDDPSSEISSLLAREQVTTRKGEKGTAPQTFYIDADAGSLEPCESRGDDFLWSSQERGVGHYARFAARKIEEGLLAKREEQEDGQRKARRVYDAPEKGVLWGWEVSAYVWTKALASGAYLMGFLAYLAGKAPPQLDPLAVGLALFFLALTGALLVKDLDQPKRFLYVLLRPQWRSWLVRGAYIISAYGALLGAQAVLVWAGRPIGGGLRWPTALAALATAVYTAFLFAQAKGRDWWASPVLSLQMAAQALAAGSSLIVLLAPFLPELAQLDPLPRWTLAASLLAISALWALELGTPHATADAARAARTIVRGRFSPLFWGGAVAMGTLVPLAIAVWAPTSWALAAAGALALAGLYMAEHIWVRAPQLIPLS